MNDNAYILAWPASLPTRLFMGVGHARHQYLVEIDWQQFVLEVLHFVNSSLRYCICAFL